MKRSASFSVFRQCLEVGGAGSQGAGAVGVPPRPLPRLPVGRSHVLCSDESSPWLRVGLTWRAVRNTTPSSSPDQLNQVVLSGPQAGSLKSPPVILTSSQGENSQTIASLSLFILPSTVFIKYPDAIVGFLCVRPILLFA